MSANKVFDVLIIGMGLSIYLYFTVSTTPPSDVHLMSKNRIVDVLIIGGGPAGLSAALTLSRTRRIVALFDSGVYRNAVSPIMNTVPRFDGTSPQKYRQGMLEEIKQRYGETFHYVPRKALNLRKTEATEGARSLFQLQDDHNETWTGRKVILACGIQDKLPAIPGFDSIWGRSVVHCVFCHGTETRGKAISILLDPTVGALGGHTILMFVQKFTNIHNDPVTIIANGVFGEGATEAKVVPELGITEDILKLVKHKGYRWEFRAVKSISTESNADSHAPPVTFNFSDGSTFTVPYVVYSPLTKAPESTVALLSDPSMSAVKDGLSQPSTMLKVPLGEIPNSGMFYKSAMDGVYVAGNAGLFMSTVVLSQSQGQLAGVGCDNEIGMEDQEDALKACADPHLNASVIRTI